MTKKLIDELVEISFDGKNLDVKTVSTIASKLKRYELKAYMRRLKTKIMKHQVRVITPRELSISSKKVFESTFSDKILSFETLPESLLGVKIINNDMVYDSTLKGEFDQITQSMRE